MQYITAPPHNPHGTPYRPLPALLWWRGQRQGGHRAVAVHLGKPGTLLLGDAQTPLFYRLLRDGSPHVAVAQRPPAL